MKQITIVSHFKSAVLIVVSIIVVYLTPHLIFAQEVERGAPTSDRQSNLNTIDYNESESIDKSVSEFKSLRALTDRYKLHISHPQPADKRSIRDFVLYNYAHVADNIINGEGMYLEALFSLLGIKAEEKTASLNKFLRILMENERIPDFSNSIAAYAK